MRMQALGPHGAKANDGQLRQRHKYNDTDENRELAKFMRDLGYKRGYYSLHDAKQAGVAIFLNDEILDPTSIRYNLEEDSSASDHHPEGRVVLASFSK